MRNKHLRTENVATNYGLVRGEAGDGLHIFRGIPYAAPPLGQLRWAMPVKPNCWSGVRDALLFSPACPQVSDDFFGDPGVTDEDCLTLNVWTPAADFGEKLPVLVWFHGGSFISGKGSQSVYEASELAKMGLVVVTLNYRLGILGSLAHPDLTAESEISTSGNYFLHDMLAALQWVRDNIGEFGGNPDNVTAMGQSSGGVSISLLLCSKLARGLFHRAFIASGYAKLNYRELAKESLGLRSMYDLYKDILLGFGPKPTIGQLRAASAEVVRRLTPSQSPMVGAATLDSVCIDGVMLTAQPTEILAQGNHAGIPVIIGTTADEGSIFSKRLGIRDVRTLHNVLQDLTECDEGEFMKIYGHDGDSATGMFSKFVTDIFVSGSRFLADSYAKTTKDVYVYRFSRLSPGFSNKGLGVYHGCELRYLFGNLPAEKGYTECDWELSHTIRSYIANFAKYGSPNGANLPLWNRYTKGSDSHLELNIPVQCGCQMRVKELGFVSGLNLSPASY